MVAAVQLPDGTGTFDFAGITTSTLDMRNKRLTPTIVHGAVSTSDLSYAYVVAGLDGPHGVGATVFADNIESHIKDGARFDTNVTSRPSAAKFRATARMRESLSPSRNPSGRADGSAWFSSTCTVPPASFTGIGVSSRPKRIRRSSKCRSAVRAK